MKPYELLQYNNIKCLYELLNFFSRPQLVFNNYYIYCIVDFYFSYMDNVLMILLTYRGVFYRILPSGNQVLLLIILKFIEFEFSNFFLYSSFIHGF